MRRFLALLGSFGSAGALQNARAELAISHTRVQAAVLARRVGTIDAVAAHHHPAEVAEPTAA